MKILEEPVSRALTEEKELFLRHLLAKGEPVFFDIETTGLSWRNSHIYLIGVIFRKNGIWTFRQWFLDSPVEEDVCLRDFYRFLGDAEKQAVENGKTLFLVHFNGDTFDIPYLRSKLGFYRISPQTGADRSLSFPSLDLYRYARPLKRIFHLGSLRQKDVELFLGAEREDVCDGGELIPVYQQYLRTGDSSTERILLLHNHDDVTGLLRILPVLAYDVLFRQEPEYFQKPLFSEPGDENNEENTDSVFLNGTLTLPVPTGFQAASDLAVFSAEDSSFSLQIPAYRGELKLFFPDYKNYYYLPVEDQAIHKSVAVYVDPEHREKAKASNCYQRVSGLFLPQPDELFSPAFRSGFHDRPLWFRPDGEFGRNPEKLSKYASVLAASCLAAGGTSKT
jgi:uncharacterized protein YprB with RNaseH-like and TPR domain